MLSLYRKFVMSNDTAALERLAEDVSTYYRKSARRDIDSFRRDRKGPQFVGEIFGILINAYGNAITIGRSDVIVTALSMPLITVIHPQNVHIPQLIFSFISMLPVGNMGARVLRYLGVPDAHVNAVVLGLFSIYYVVQQNYKQRKNYTPRPLEVLPRAAITFGTLRLAHAFQKVVSARTHVHQLIVLTALSFLIRGFLENVANIGPLNMVSQLVQNTISHMFHRKFGELEPLPFDIEVPEPLMCHICHDLLNEPKESLGFFFCRNCLDEWLRHSELHPYTGLPIDRSKTEQSMIMELISMKWRKLTLDKIRRENGN